MKSPSRREDIWTGEPSEFEARTQAIPRMMGRVVASWLAVTGMAPNEKHIDSGPGVSSLSFVKTLPYSCQTGGAVESSWRRGRMFWMTATQMALSLLTSANRATSRPAGSTARLVPNALRLRMALGQASSIGGCAGLALAWQAASSVQEKVVVELPSFHRAAMTQLTGASVAALPGWVTRMVRMSSCGMFAADKEGLVAGAVTDQAGVLAPPSLVSGL
ncbi:hypothetical protein MFUL124B02_11405 [Myxococcus fulvus 124B02]|nr:hypothetical protein MFUL124B02_11405 [Myxococcus fulvus 124B02]